MLPERALYWRARDISRAISSSEDGGRRRGADTLVIADPHFGKAAAFRAVGIPVPAGSTTASLDRLSAALQRTHARRLVILGDFFHARRGRADRTLAAIARWREQWSELRIVLVRGNHDANSGDPPAEWGVECVGEPWCDGPLCFRHTPPEHDDAIPAGARAPGGFTLAGHVHPVVNLCDALGTSLRPACFVFGRHTAILPAFGRFTGGHPIRPRAGDRAFAVAEDAVVEVPVRDT